MAPLATKRRTHRCRRCGKERKWHVCTAGGPQQPPTAGQGIPDQSKPVDIDRISDLPDELLCTIVSLLPFKDGARTRLLSRRWRNLWLSAPLNLDDGDLEVGDFRRWRRRAYLQGLITRILSTHPGPIRRLCLTSFSHTSTWDTWFRYPVLDKLEELQFRYNRMPLIKDLLPLSALIRFSDLRVASYGRCNFPEDLGGVTFPKLRELTLYELTNSESTLHAMISACPALRSLFLRNNVGFRRVRISSQRLISLGISVETRTMEELIIVNAPSMEKLLIFDTDGVPKNICVMFAPKLEVMGCLSNKMLNVQLEATVFQKLVAISPIKSLQAVKIFSLRAAGFKLEIVMDFLKCFPCLEKLYYFESRPWEDESGQILNGGPSIECLDRHLKEIVLIDYQGTSGGVNFVRFFVLNARVLKVVEFQVPFDCSKKWKAKHKRLLPKRKDWASQVAKLNFVHGTYFRHWQNEYHTHELLSYDNPFGCQ